MGLQRGTRLKQLNTPVFPLYLFGYFFPRCVEKGRLPKLIGVILLPYGSANSDFLNAYSQVGSFHTVAFQVILENSSELYLHKKKYNCHISILLLLRTLQTNVEKKFTKPGIPIHFPLKNAIHKRLKYNK